jgi:hypothetical protein
MPEFAGIAASAAGKPGASLISGRDIEGSTITGK